MPEIIVTEHCKREWSRMAQDAYRTDRNVYGHRYSVAATLRTAERMELGRYDALMRDYRKWLVFGWTEVER